MPPKNKRKRDEDDEDLGNDKPGSQVLPVASHLPADGVPTDGAEFLLAVRMASAQLPSFTKVVNPFFVPQDEYDSGEGYGKTRAVHPFLPSNEWKDSFVQSFKRFRENVQNVEIDEGKRSEISQYRLPAPKDRPGWRIFLFGRLEEELLPTGPSGASPNSEETEDVAKEEPEDDPELAFINSLPQAGVNLDDASTSDEEDAAPLQNQYSYQPVTDAPTEPNGTGMSAEIFENDAAPSELKYPPDPSIPLLRRFSQTTITQLLIFYDHWLSEDLSKEPSDAIVDAFPISDDPSVALTSHHSKWLFTLLAHYDNILATSRNISALRSIARSCVHLIARSHHHEAILASTENMLFESEVKPEEDEVEREEGDEFQAGESENEADAETDEGENEKRSADHSSGRSGCWMIVAAVTFIWGQVDLWDDANKILLQEAQ